MKKKILAVMLAAVLASGSVPAMDLTNNTFAAEAAKKKVPSLKKIHKAITDKYGDNFVADVSLTKEEIKVRYGISQSWYTDISAEVPMISANVDTLVIAKSKNKNTKKKIKSALVKYRQSLVDDTMQYPMNVMKIQASRVYVKGDYVFYIMLGFIDDEIEKTGTDEQILAAYKAQNKKAVDAINALFK